MDAEQTWPTEEELAEAKAQRKKIVKRVPKGTHEYQAAWIPDEDGEELSECSNEMSVDEPKSEADSGPDAEDEEEYETITVFEVPDERYDIDMTEKCSNGKLEEYVCRIYVYYIIEYVLFKSTGRRPTNRAVPDGTHDRGCATTQGHFS
ncbi:pre-rRNA-processing protein TSR1 homolog [Bombus affinis]|uniref:pre-rRNA-processing protein TSR1 homolog n=1 Tax=Bombus affinis TaxID=309941 RepID=UPI0021B72E8C|nr:pre-rRNA-processing protein TSR1 homolog [Bombus affinis]